MKKVKLNSTKYPNKYALVDDEDFEYLNQFKWRPVKAGNTFYAKRHLYTNGKRTTITMHREILGTKNKLICIDHINCNGLNNQRKNLRTCTRQQNQMNRAKANKNSTSKYKGVCWDKSRTNWMSTIHINRIQINLGRFNNEIDAAKAYDKAAKELFGEFANLNFSYGK